MALVLISSFRTVIQVTQTYLEDNLPIPAEEETAGIGGIGGNSNTVIGTGQDGSRSLVTLLKSLAEKLINHFGAVELTSPRLSARTAITPNGYATAHIQRVSKGLRYYRKTRDDGGFLTLTSQM